MSAGTEPIAVLVMSYNDMAALRLCLRALVNRTERAHRLVVVDNASTDPRLKRYLGKLAAFTTISVYRNRRNLWVLGLNRALREQVPRGGHDTLFALTDCDILVPPRKGGACWLTRLEATMKANASIGKLGLSLDLGYIKTRPQFAATYRDELFFMRGPHIGDNVVAPVDTTMALYRCSFLVTPRPLFIPGHASLSRPYYFCCRTAPDFCAKHLSWRRYASRPADDVVAKMVCFGLVGATVSPVLHALAPWPARLFYRVARPLARLFWGLAVVLLQAAYVLRTFPRNANQLQAERRTPAPSPEPTPERRS